MTDLLKPHFSWMFFLGTVVFLLLFYSLLRFLERQIHQLPLSLKFRDSLSSKLRSFLLLYDLIFIVITASEFVLLNPIWHGIVILFLISITFPLMKNYMIGRFLCFDPEFQQNPQPFRHVPHQPSRRAGRLARPRLPVRHLRQGCSIP